MSDIALPNTGVPALPRGERLLSDELLAKLAGRGSSRAFATLYERHHQALYRYCRSIVHNDHDAQDALQSAMMRAYAALRARERELAVRPWLFRIAHNEAISILRRRGSEHELGDDYEQLGGGVEHTLEVRERLSTLVADLRTLSERQRAALVMRELSGLSIGEIAGAMSISSGTAKQTLFEARSTLHELSEGRAMRCEAIREAISQRDGRVLRGRRIQAHLRVCEECREFRAAIGARRSDLLALAPPLPASVAGTVLSRLLAHGGGHASGVAAAGSGASLGGHAMASMVAKGLVGLTVIAAGTAGAVQLTARHNHRGAVVTKPLGASGTAGPGSANTPVRGTRSSGASKLHARGRPAAGGSQTQTPASTPSEQGGGSLGGADNQEGMHGGRVGPDAQRPLHGSQSRGGSHRHTKTRSSAPSRSHRSRQDKTHGKPVAKRPAPAAQAPQHSTGSQGTTRSGHEAARARPPADKSSEERGARSRVTR